MTKVEAEQLRLAFDKVMTARDFMMRKTSFMGRGRCDYERAKKELRDLFETLTEK